MRGRQIWTIFMKEIRETLRDRRTLVAMVGIPVLVYPLLAIGVSQLVAMQAAALKEEKVRVAVIGDHGGILDVLLADDRLEYAKDITDKDDAIARLEDGELEVVLVVAPVEGREALELELNYTIAEDRSNNAQYIMLNMLRRVYLRGASERLEEKGLDFRKITPMSIRVKNVNPELQGGFVFGRMMALLLVMLAVTFPFHPALDLGAGEKERGTLETLLVSPAGRREIVMGKYLAVLAIGILGSVLNLGSMALTFGYFADMTKQLSEKGAEYEAKYEAANKKLGDEFFGEEKQARAPVSFSIGAADVAKILLALIPLVALFSAVSVMLSTLARSYKEGQHYLTPLLVIVMPLSMVSLIPNMHLTAYNAWIPVANVVLLVKDLFVEKLQLVPFLITLGSTLFFAAIALWGTVKLFEREEVLFRETGQRTTRMRPLPCEVPPQLAAWVVFAVAMILMIFAGQKVGEALSALVVDQQLSPLSAVVLAVVFSQGVLLVTTLAGVWYCRARLTPTLALRGTGARRIGAGVLVGLGGAVVAMMSLHWIIAAFPGLQEKLVEMEKQLGALLQMPFYLQLIMIALVPALVEELLFRGFLLQTLRRSMKPAAAIVIVAALFAFSHQIFLKYPPTFLMGLLAGWMVYRAGSVWVGVAMHLAWNGLLVISTHERVAWLFSAQQQPYLKAGIGLAMVVLGVYLMERLTRSASVDLPAETR